MSDEADSLEDGQRIQCIFCCYMIEDEDMVEHLDEDHGLKMAMDKSKKLATQDFNEFMRQAAQNADDALVERIRGIAKDVFIEMIERQERK